MKLAIVGTGYVGLVSGTCFAELGWEVTCIDKDVDKIAALQRGDMPIYEDGLAELVAESVAAHRLHFTTDLCASIAAADLVFIAVGTPPHPETGHADLHYVYAAAEEIAQSVDGFTVVITKSTVPIGTNREIAAIMAKHCDEGRFAVASNPEFLREGVAIADFMQPDRIVIGVEDARAQSMLAQLYQPLTNKGIPLLSTGIETAEMIKYASNSFLATKIAFINEMADICEKVGADVENVALGMGMDERIGSRFLRPGPGYGGSCFPKDAQALAKIAASHEVDPFIINSVITYNLHRRTQMVEKVNAACGGSVQGKKLAVLGLTFKANTDDMRESPALVIIPKLLEAGATINAYDPEGMDNAKALLPDSINYADDSYACASDADAVIILTEWEEFAALDLGKLRDAMHSPLIIDMRNLYQPEIMQKAGFNYHSIGRKAMKQ